MKIITKPIISVLLISFLVVLNINVFSQDNEKAVVEKLSEKDRNKVAKAEKLLSKGILILKEASGYDVEIAAMKDVEGRLKMRKINKLEKKSNSIKIKASKYLQDGYKKKVKVYESVLKDSRKLNPQLASRLKEVEFNSDKKIKKSKKLYRKANDMASKSKAVEYFEIGHKNYQEAIVLLCEGLAVVFEIEPREVVNDAVAEKDTLQVDESSIEKEVETVPEGNATDSTEVTTTNAIANPAVTGGVVAATTAAAVVAVSKDTVSDENDSAVKETEEEVIAEDTTSLDAEPQDEKSGDVFFTIQFMADKKSVSPAQLKAKYVGDKEVIEMNTDGWYRYSVGKFTNLEEAKGVMKTEGIKGFIVAYKNGERITVSDALELLK